MTAHNKLSQLVTNQLENLKSFGECQSNMKIFLNSKFLSSSGLWSYAALIQFWPFSAFNANLTPEGIAKFFDKRAKLSNIQIHRLLRPQFWPLSCNYLIIGQIMGHSCHHRSNFTTKPKDSIGNQCQKGIMGYGQVSVIACYSNLACFEKTVRTRIHINEILDNFGYLGLQKRLNI